MASDFDFVYTNKAPIIIIRVQLKPRRIFRIYFFAPIFELFLKSFTIK